MGKKLKRLHQKTNNNNHNSTKQKENNIIKLNDYKKERKKEVDIIPRNLNQETLLDSLNDSNKKIIFSIGPAGSGKTLISTLWGIKLLKSNKIKKLVITRPNVAVDDKDIGYLPGDVLSKMTPWMLPIMDILEEFYSPQEINTLVEEKIIEICPIAYIRGRTFKNSYIIIDEAQGTTPNSMKSILTRIGENSKMVVTGDINQSDLGKDNGLSDLINRFVPKDSLDIIKFETNDVERSEVVKDILNLYNE